MQLKRTLEREIRFLVSEPKELILSCACTVIIGVLTWLSCDGISIIWRMSKHPPLTVPLAILFIMWILDYFLFGVLLSLCISRGVGGSLCLKAAVAYLATLFWCPLTLISGVFLCSILSLALSLLYLFFVARVIAKFSLVACLSVTLIAACEIYLLYFTAAFTLMN